MGEDRWRQLKSKLHFPPAGALAATSLILLAVWWMPNILLYLAARLYWANITPHSSSPPEPGDFFRLGMIGWGVLTLLIIALLHELAWRGYAQPRFIKQYGQFRGICLVGILWGAAHWRYFPRAVAGDAGILLALLGAFLWGVALAFPLAWLTLRSGSIWPAVMAAATNRMLIDPEVTEGYRIVGRMAAHLFLIALWSLLGFVLFRYFPVNETSPQPEAVPAITAEHI
jgi:membrane protease YdiL (CAAX protease family)